MSYVYIAGPYGDGDPFEVIDERIARARAVAVALATRGVPYFSPHLNAAHMQVVAPDVPRGYWLALGLTFVDYAFGLILLPDWRSSFGAVNERAAAIRRDIPVWDVPSVAGFDVLADRIADYWAARTPV